MTDPSASLHPELAALDINRSSSSYPELRRITSERKLHTKEQNEVDAQIFRMFNCNVKLNEPPDLDILLYILTNYDNDLKTLSYADAERLIVENPAIEKELKKAWDQRSFAEVRNLAILWPSPLSPPSIIDDRKFLVSKNVNELAWKWPYVGKAVESLKKHIALHYRNTVGTLYAHYTSIIQSSGMGKSRLIDELSKSHFVIRMNLRARGTGGFPPPDDALRNFLVPVADGMLSHRRAYAFLLALFEEATSSVENLRELAKLSGSLSPTEKEIAEDFRKLMTRGQTMKCTGNERKGFYDRVLAKANKSWPDQDGGDDELLAKAARNLQIAIQGDADDISPLPSPQENKKKSEVPIFPIIFLEFDEAHYLMDPKTREEGTGSSSYFSKFQCLLRWIQVHDLPVFSFFLSTTWTRPQFTPLRTIDSSTRVMEEQYLLPTYTDLGFDQAMKGREVQKGSHTIDEVAGLEFMAHLGRPLFGTLYDAARNHSIVQMGILRFAEMKLINQDLEWPRPRSLFFGLKSTQKLACFAARLALEFIPMTFSEIWEEQKQVESHMRVYLTDDFGSMKTVSPSEPLLAEAAAQLMMHSEYLFDAPKALISVLKHYAIKQGGRGELLAMLLLCLARDNTIRDDHFVHPRVATVDDFMSNLFNAIKSSGTFQPSVLADKVEAESFTSAFENSYVYFSHFIKVDEYKIINRKYLTALIVRGAAILCANCQSGVDVIIPFLYKDTKIQRSSVGVILVQVSNDAKYTAKPEQALFDQMDPFALGIFSEGDIPVPIIRIVFALASPTPGFTQILRKCSESQPRFSTSYDFWSAGLSADHLGPIDKEWKEAIWKELLQATRPWERIYALPNAGVQADLRRNEHPAAGEADAHWENWFVHDHDEKDM